MTRRQRQHRKDIINAVAITALSVTCTALLIMGALV